MSKTDKQNVSYSLQENKKNNETDVNVTYEDILKEVDVMDVKDGNINYDFESSGDYDMEAYMGMDDYIASELDYQTNYIKKDLERIADYYEISKRKKRKDELVEAIVLFEKDPVNIQKVYQRKKLWKYMEEIKKDKYLRQFLILD